MIHALAAPSAESKLEPFDFDPGELRPDQVEIDVTYCGICHSDLMMIDDGAGMSRYPLVPGHEAAGTVAAAGEAVPDLPEYEKGAPVGLGWYARSCMHCRQCLGGDHNLCPDVEGTIIHRHGAYATRVRCHWAWATPLPAGMDLKSVGPLMCGGITVFNPLVQFDVRPTHRVGVIGIGGLGHLALQFLKAWGCDVTAFTHSDDKADFAKGQGATHVVNSRDPSALKPLAGSLDLILNTAPADLPWEAYLGALAPKGRLHTVGIPHEPIAVPATALLQKQKSLSGSPLGSPATTRQMIDFAARHGVAPIIEQYKMTEANDALDHLRAGKARYRIVLEQDLAA